MKRYVEVSKRVGGRTITQRYPARSVGEVLWDLPYCEPMACIGGCGYIRCSQTGPCAPKTVAAPPPADALPEGWIGGMFDEYDHRSGASVALIANVWCWWPPGAGAGDDCTDPKPTRDEAMAAALAQSEEPYGCVRRRGISPRECVESGHYWCDFNKLTAEPALRPGWEIRGKFMGKPDYWFGDFNVCSSAGSDGNDGDWSVCNERGLELWRRPTLEAAMERAEAIARGEP